jgi:dimethylargininase
VTLKLTALIRPVSSRLGEAELTHLARRSIDVASARRQHRAYASLLGRLGIEVVELLPLDDHPDGVFVEDAAVVVPGLAVVTRPGAPTRRAEVDSVESALRTLVGRVERMVAPARLDGGDVLRIGSTVFVGRSTRTDEAGIASLSAHLQPAGYRVVTVGVSGCLHLKTAAGALPDGTLLIGPGVAATAFELADVLEVPEPSGANVLVVGETVVISAGAPSTAELVRRRGFDVRVLDISQLEAVEGGVTCLSLLIPQL